METAITAVTTAENPNPNPIHDDGEKVEVLPYVQSVPPVAPGYRFTPSDEELVKHYLIKKVNDEPLPPTIIKDVNIYMYTPDYLAKRYKLYGLEEKVWYFFTSRDRKHPKGKRPNRSAGNGYWKATGKDKCVLSGGKKIGMKRSLVYYRGKASQGEKTKWMMHEYKALDDPNRPRHISSGISDKLLDKWVLCKLYVNPKAAAFKEKAQPKAAVSKENNEVIPYQNNDAANDLEELLNEKNASSSEPDAFLEYHNGQNPDDMVVSNNQEDQYHNHLEFDPQPPELMNSFNVEEFTGVGELSPLANLELSVDILTGEVPLPWDYYHIDGEKTMGQNFRC